MPDDLRKVLTDLSDTNKNFDTRFNQLETREYSLLRWFAATAYALDSVSVTLNVVYTTANMVTTLGIPPTARGIVGSIWSGDNAATLYFASSGTTPTAYMQYIYVTAANGPHMFMVGLGTDGAFNILSNATVTLAATAFAYWL